MNNRPLNASALIANRVEHATELSALEIEILLSGVAYLKARYCSDDYFF